MTMRIALVQMQVSDGDPATSVARAEALVRAAPAADVYLLPELFTTGYAHDAWPGAARDATPGAIDALQRLADERGAWVAGSMVASTPGGGLANRLHLLAPRAHAGEAIDAVVVAEVDAGVALRARAAFPVLPLHVASVDG